MNIGENILKYRKNIKMSQEQLAQELGVSRQTISNWELNETAPDLKQAQELVKIFNISLDDLIGINKSELIYNKVDNIDNTSHAILHILKFTGITLGILLFLILVIIISAIFFANYFKVEPISNGIGTYCTYHNETIYYEVVQDTKTKEITLYTTNQELNNNFNSHNYRSYDAMFNDIEKYIVNNGGTCNITNQTIENFAD